MYSNLSSKNIYGDIPITKEECVNHVHKRMTSAFRKLIKDGSHLGVRFGGKGPGKLTAAIINKLGNYFSKAVSFIRYSMSIL